jgi:hypothetical protein
VLGHYAGAHALAAFAMMGADPAQHAAQRILGWLERAAVPAFSTRDAYRELRTLKPERARAGLAELAERGWIRPLADGKRTGRPSERWAVHPGVWDR